MHLDILADIRNDIHMLPRDEVALDIILDHCHSVVELVNKMKDNIIDKDERSTFVDRGED